MEQFKNYKDILNDLRYYVIEKYSNRSEYIDFIKNLECEGSEKKKLMQSAAVKKYREKNKEKIAETRKLKNKNKENGIQGSSRDTQ